MGLAREYRAGSNVPPVDRPHVLWLRRAPSDHPYAEIAEHLVEDFDIEFCDWDEDRVGRKRARSLIVQRPAHDREPVSVTLPRWFAIRALLFKNSDAVVVKEVGLLTALAGLGSMVRRRRKVVCLVQHHPRYGGPAVAARWKRPFRRLLGAGVDTFVANTPDACHWLLSEMQVSPDRVVHHWWLAGLEHESPGPEFREAAAGPTSATVDVNQRSIRLVFAGSLTDRKRPQLAIELVAELVRTDRVVTLDVLGAGRLRTRLEALAERLNVATAVTFHGHRDRSQMASYFAAADLLVLPSAEELLGRVVVEAMSCGLPTIVTSTVGAAHGLVIDGINGLVQHGLDPAAWAHRIASLSESDWAQLRTHTARSAPSLSTSSCADGLRAVLCGGLSAR